MISLYNSIEKKMIENDYDFNNDQSLEDLVIHNEVYSTEKDKSNSDSPKKYKGSTFKIIKEIFRKLWKAIVNFIKNLFKAISEKWAEHKLEKELKKDNDKKRQEILNFTKNAQELVKEMDKSIKCIDKTNDTFDIFYTAIQNKTNVTAEEHRLISLMYVKISQSMKIIVLVEQMIYKTFTKFREDVIKGNIKSSGNNKIKSFTDRFNKLSESYRDLIESIKKSANSDKFSTLSSVSKFKKLVDVAGDLIIDSTGFVFHMRYKNSENGILESRIVDESLRQIQDKLNDKSLNGGKSLEDNIMKRVFGYEYLDIKKSSENLHLDENIILAANF